MDSVWSLATHKHDIEFIIKADDDDPATIDIVKQMSVTLPYIRTTLLTGPRGRGYHDIHEWTSWMCRESRGDWLLIFNDDARMKTENWDDIVLRVVPPQSWPAARDVCVMVFATINRPFAQEFLLLRRETFKLLGSVGSSPHADNWIYSITKMLDVVIHPPIFVEHHSEHMKDATRVGSTDAHRTSITTLNSMAAIRTRCHDMLRLLDYMERSEMHAPWRDTPPTCVDWVRWRKTPQHPPSCMLLHGDGSGIVISEQHGLCLVPNVTADGGQWALLDGCGTGVDHS
jgi:hypothetical protein